MPAASARSSGRWWRRSDGMLRRAACVLAVVLGPVVGSAQDHAAYVGFLAGSWHVGNDDLNNATPGITFGRRGPVPQAPDTEWHVEGGVFFNSYREVAPILLAGLSRDVGDFGPGRLRLGVSAGTAYYRALSRDLKADYGIPNLGGFIPVVAATAALRIDRTDVRLSLVPPGENTIAIFNLSVSQPF